MTLTRHLILFMTLATSFSALAGPAEEKQVADQDPARYYSVQNIEVSEIPDTAETTKQITSALAYVLPNSMSQPILAVGLNNPCSTSALQTHGELMGIGTVGIVLDQIISIGAKVWKVADSQKAVVNTAAVSANALPRGLECWLTLEGWQAPRSHTYHIKYTNMFGMNVVDFIYRVGFSYGGNFHGQGLYLANAFVQAAELSVAWGYKFDSQAQVTSVLNVGSTKSPVAGMQLELNWHVTSLFTNSQKTEVFFVTGDGGMRRLK